MSPWALPVEFVDARNQWEQVTTLADLSTVGRAALASLQAIAKLPQGWDGRNSPPLNPAARMAAANLLKGIDFNGMPGPHVAPVAGGGVQFEWRLKECELEVEIHPTGQATFLAMRDDDTLAEGETDDVWSVARLVQSLAAV